MGESPVIASIVPLHEQSLWTAERDVREVLDLLSVGETQRGHPLRQHFEHDAGLDLGEVGAEAVVDALAEGDVARRVGAMDVERVWCFEQVGLSICSGEVQ